MTNKCQITVKDIPPQMQNILHICGLETCIEIIKRFGGQKIYIPKKQTIERMFRNKKIFKKFTGGNLEVLAQEYKISKRQIKNIINAQADKL